MIEVILGTLAETPASALLNPVDAQWQPATPAARRVAVAAGAQLDAQRHALGDLPVGSAAITSGGELRAQFLIHVVVRSREEAVSPTGVRRALENGLRRAAEWGIRDVAMPPLGTGAGNLDAEESAAIMLPVLLEHLGGGACPSQVRIVVESAYELEAFQRELAREPAQAPPLPLLDDWLTPPG